MGVECVKLTWESNVQQTRTQLSEMIVPPHTCPFSSVYTHTSTRHQEDIEKNPDLTDNSESILNLDSNNSRFH